MHMMLEVEDRAYVYFEENFWDVAALQNTV
jgi:hypothetical protein